MPDIVSKVYVFTCRIAIVSAPAGTGMTMPVIGFSNAVPSIERSFRRFQAVIAPAVVEADSVVDRADDDLLGGVPSAQGMDDVMKIVDIQNSIGVEDEAEMAKAYPSLVKEYNELAKKHTQLLRLCVIASNRHMP